MQGNCSAVPPSQDLLLLPEGAAPLQPLKQQQCVLIVSGNLFTVDESDLWMDNIYVRARVEPDSDPFQEMLEMRDEARVWMTNVTLQGDGTKKEICKECGLEALYDVKLYAKGAAAQGGILLQSRG